ncbi:hypothetical protein ANCCEY_02873 [Ancylostoma ceylanicum]|uniref:Uncharacterized protein n=1 Tax=Ancylostoma ceylanicum TaxID=53326 RepID=A0A0D6M1S4_9BILA|nr:hypothetical protein ANCCEY_02873 [Ancylostoma ceylanicum]
MEAPRHRMAPRKQDETTGTTTDMMGRRDTGNLESFLRKDIPEQGKPKKDAVKLCRWDARSGFRLFGLFNDNPPTPDHLQPQQSQTTDKNSSRSGH